MSQTDSRHEEYRERQQRFAALAERSARLASRISNLRLVVFLAAIFFAGWWLFGETRFDTLAGLISAALVIGFVALLKNHQRVLSEQQRNAGLAEINAQALARLDRNWEGIPLAPADPMAMECPFAADLDLFGRRSLFHLIALPSSPLGRRKLSRWLVEPATPDEIARRQAAVVELAPGVDLRQDLALLGRAIRNTEVDPFLGWTRERLWLADRPWLLWCARLLPLSIATLAILQLFGVIPFALWIVPLIATVTLSFAYCGQIHAIFIRIAKHSGEIRSYVDLLELMFSRRYESSELNAILDEARVGQTPAHQELDHLRRIMDCADLRFSQMAYGVIQALTLWDIHILALAERWQQKSGHGAAHWFDALARFESLAALANLAYDHADWTLPKITAAGDDSSVVAQRIGHPLLSDRARVVNDVCVGPPGSFLLVTGSNMSGKSTLLRSIGMNVVLAQAGAPVCAAQFELPPVHLGTSIRVQDSLGDGISLFMAELKRLKQVVDSALQTEARGERVFLYLLDEILHGTNTVERQIAIRRVMLHLLRHRAIGAISTHDLALAKVEPLSTSCQPVHFRETFREGPAGHEMSFDYHLRSGVATTTNALKLLEMVGLTMNGEPYDQRAPSKDGVAVERN